MLLLSSTCFVLPMASQEQALSNQSVIDMVVGKLPKDLILQKMKSSPAAYDVSPTGLVKLNEAKVPKEIIKLMLSAPRGGEAVPPAATVVAPRASAPEEEPAPQAPPAREPRPMAKGGPAENTAATASPTSSLRARKPKPLLTRLPGEPGIHLHGDDNDDLMLEPNGYDGSKTSNMLGSALTGGLSKAKMKAVIGGSEAALRTTDADVEFYFVFEKSTASLGGSNNSWYAALTSPNQFKLLRLDKKTSNREVTTASVGAFSAQSGTDEKAVVRFTFVRLRAGVYRVIPKEPLLPGEYAFFPAAMGGQGTAGAGMSQIFDFGVDQH
ncbi:MAG: hypothetical protein V4558_14950 [Gemmatimonadota bacterium]